MKNFTILMAASVRGFKPNLFDAHSPSVLLDAVKEEYHFRIAPTIEQLAQAPAGPFNFLYGRFKHGGRTIVVEQLLITYVGITATSVGATTKIGTSESSLFLDHLVNYMRKEFGVDTTSRFPNYYHSTVEVEFGRPLSSHFDKFRGLGDLIASKVHGYEYRECPYELSGFSMHFDTSAQKPPYLGPFTVERRVGVPYTDNKYFSQAPLSTKDHENVLSVLETLFALE
jgi:hypothetical protein